MTLEQTIACALDDAPCVPAAMIADVKRQAEAKFGKQ
jgi:hypothetical protein